jgi:excisionase family DNA binding protein
MTSERFVPLPEFITVREAATWLGWNRNTVRKWIWEKRLNMTQRPDRAWRISRDELLRFVMTDLNGKR